MRVPLRGGSAGRSEVIPQDDRRVPTSGTGRELARNVSTAAELRVAQPRASVRFPARVRVTEHYARRSGLEQVVTWWRGC